VGSRDYDYKLTFFCYVKVKKVKISLFQAVEAHRVARG
jgi:hypothetical protein